jgi:hypothetical protein
MVDNLFVANSILGIEPVFVDSHVGWPELSCCASMLKRIFRVMRPGDGRLFHHNRWHHHNVLLALTETALLRNYVVVTILVEFAFSSDVLAVSRVAYVTHHPKIAGFRCVVALGCSLLENLLWNVLPVVLHAVLGPRYCGHHGHLFVNHENLLRICRPNRFLRLSRLEAVHEPDCCLLFREVI